MSFGDTIHPNHRDVVCGDDLGIRDTSQKWRRGGGPQAQPPARLGPLGVHIWGANS